MNLEIYGLTLGSTFFVRFGIWLFRSKPSLGSFNLMIYAFGSASSALEIALIDAGNTFLLKKTWVENRMLKKLANLCELSWSEKVWNCMLRDIFNSHQYYSVYLAWKNRKPFKKIWCSKMLWIIFSNTCCFIRIQAVSYYLELFYYKKFVFTLWIKLIIIILGSNF